MARGDVVARRFEVEEHLGDGMLGATYRVRNLQSSKVLALKILRPELTANPKDRERFEQAFATVAQIKHDSLVRYGEIGEHQGQVFLTLDYFESQSLRQLIDEYQANQQSFTLQEACQVVVSVLEALEYLHSQGVYHRNLKPENVLVHTRKIGPGGGKTVRTIRVTDAGLSELFGGALLNDSLLSGRVMPYLAPEHTGFRLAGAPTSDVYSVGVMLYELLVGQTPRGTYLSPTQLRGDLPEHIDDIVELAVATSPEDRYPTAADMRNDIQRSFGSEMLESDTRGSIRNVLIGLGVGLVVLLAAGAYVGLREQPDPMADNRKKDEMLRATVAAGNHLPTEAELTAMVQDHPEMLYIPPGSFVMGRLHQEDLRTASQSEPLAKGVKVDGFYIDRYEFPNRMNDNEGNPMVPVAKVTWKQAEEACQSLGKRLCKETEWEKACKGPASLIYSYGDTFNPEACGESMDSAYTIGMREQCISGYGVFELSGGVREWTASVAGGKNNRRVVKGGLRANHPRGSRCAFAVDESADYADTSLSFRCCLDLDATAAPEDGTAPGTPAPAAPE